MTERKSPRREFILSAGVEAATVKDIIVGIHDVNYYDDEQSAIVGKEYRCKPIKLITDSPGGDCYAGMTLVNTIDSSRTPVYTYSYGQSMSMGLLLFVAGHLRHVHPNATFMHHQLSGTDRGTLMHIIESAEQKLALQELMDGYLLSRTNIDQETILQYRNTKTDWYFTGIKALEYGVADKLIKSTHR